MNFDKIAPQIEQQRAKGLEAVFGLPSISMEVGPDSKVPTPVKAKQKPAAPAAKASKRTTWKACTFYLPPETKARLERVLLKRKLGELGGASDQSEAINEALEAWLAKAEKSASSIGA